MARTRSYDDFSSFIDFKLKKGEIREIDADIAHRFMNEYVAQRGVRPRTSFVNTEYLILLLKKVKIDKCTTTNILKMVNDIRSSHKDNTVRKFLMVLIPFLEWMKKEQINPGLKYETLNFKPPSRVMLTKTPADVLTPDEVLNILGSTRSSRDRAVLALMYDAGLRSAEVSNLQWRHIVFDSNGAVVYIPLTGDIHEDPKTKYARRIRITTSVPYLKKWMDDYPGKPENSAPVFLNFKGEGKGDAISYQAIKKLIKAAGRKAKVNGKRIHPHTFRHARITHLLEKGVPEITIKKMFWGKSSTTMLSVYEHMSDDAMDDHVLCAQGLNPNIKKEVSTAMDSGQCPSCDAIIIPGQRFCLACGNPLTKEARQTQTATTHTLDKQITTFTAEDFEKYKEELKKELLAEIKAELKH